MIERAIRRVLGRSRGETPRVLTQPQVVTLVPHEGPRSSIQDELVAAFTELPEPQNRGIVVKMGINRGTQYAHYKDSAGHGVIQPVDDARPSVVMLPDGLYFVPMEKLDFNRQTPPQGDIVGRYVLTDPEYEQYREAAHAAIDSNRTAPQPIRYTYNALVPQKEVSFEAVFLTVNALTRPQGKRAGQLQRKQREYQERIKAVEAGKPHSYVADTLYRIAILDKLLKDGSVAKTEFDNPEWRTQGEGRNDYRAFTQAWFVIEDYVTTGGANLSGSTGLR